jgi:predicted lipoprotein
MWRSVRTMRSLGGNLQNMHRWTEAAEMYRRALAIVPGDMNSFSGAVVALVGAGDLPGARGLLANAVPTVDRSMLFAYTAMFQDLYWVLARAQQDSLLAAPASVFNMDGSGRTLPVCSTAHR